MTSATEPDSQGAHFVGGTPFFASRHDQRLSYALYVPKDHTAQADPLPLVVIQHGTGRSAELYRNNWKQFAIDHGCVILTPLFPDSGNQLQSGWLIGGESLNGAVNGLSWTIGDGYVVTFGNEIGFRTWNRSEQRMLFNAAYYGPSTKLTAAQFQRLGK